jgi:hypothetical protein
MGGRGAAELMNAAVKMIKQAASVVVFILIVRAPGFQVKLSN